MIEEVYIVSSGLLLHGDWAHNLNEVLHEARGMAASLVHPIAQATAHRAKYVPPRRPFSNPIP